MLDDNPVLKERLMACGAFGGIALFGVAAVNVLISGGFDFGAERAAYERHHERPTAYVRVVDAANYVGDRFRSMSWNEPLSIDDAEAATSDLAGANEGSAAADDAASGDGLRQQIAALYAGDAQRADEPDYYDAREIEDEPAAAATYRDDLDAETDKAASAYGNE